MKMSLGKSMIAASAAALLSAGAAVAQEKPFNIYVGYSAGGGYDVYGRIVARHINRHLPGNPTVVVNNMPGAGSMRLANWIYNVAPKDGNTMGTSPAALPSTRCSDSPAPSSTRLSSAGSAAPTTKSASASPGTPAA